MTRPARLATCIAVLAWILVSAGAQAQMRGRGGMTGGMGGGVERKEYDVVATGLTVRFPAGMECPPIASPYGSPYRFDGSLRRQDRNSGLHGGLDISLIEGTPLLAIAAGEVLAKGAGGNLEGNYLWLRHAPEDTGLGFWSFTKYQHLDDVPQVEVGQRVAVGAEVARSGMTGTIGPAFGPQGYPHLHLGLFVSPSADFVREGAGGSTVTPRGGKLADPLLLFLPQGTALADTASVPASELAVAAMAAGRPEPTGARVVWPVGCKLRAGPAD